MIEGIVNMDLGKLQYFEKIENPSQKEFMTEQNNCILCGQPLELLHILIENEVHIKEEASCSHCNLKARAKIFTLN